jgi:hypothetical protein
VRHHHTPQHPARATHQRPADPETTRQARDVVAMAEHTCPNPAICGYDVLGDFYARDLAQHLPDVDPALLGRIVLAVGATVAGGMRLVGLDIDHGTGLAEGLAGTAVTLLGITGGRMYLNATGQIETGA